MHNIMPTVSFTRQYQMTLLWGANKETNVALCCSFYSCLEQRLNKYNVLPLFHSFWNIIIIIVITLLFYLPLACNNNQRGQVGAHSEIPSETPSTLARDKKQGKMNSSNAINMVRVRHGMPHAMITLWYILEFTDAIRIVEEDVCVLCIKKVMHIIYAFVVNAMILYNPTPMAHDDPDSSFVALYFRRRGIYGWRVPILSSVDTTPSQCSFCSSTVIWADSSTLMVLVFGSKKRKCYFARRWSC